MSELERPERRLYVVATVHLDTQWRWTIQDTIRDFIPATLQRNFELLERHSFFVVSFEGAFRYMLMQEYYPDQFEQLKQWVAAGRWRPAGSMLDSPDVNVVAPESLLRHILYGNRFFESALGQRSHDLFLPDCFGFGFALPSVAHHCRLKGFSAQKFGRWMAPATIPFDVGVWQGPDGGEVVAAIRPEGYGEGLHEDLSVAQRYIERLDRTGKECGAAVGLKYVGVGDRGGGLDDTSIEWLERSVSGKGPASVVVSGSDQLFLDLSPEQVDKLPRHRGELLLPTHGTGCLSSQAVLKRWNRRNEQLADAAERSAVIAHWLGALPYPADHLRQAWIRFLWHQMHDDLTGTSIPAAYRFTSNDELVSLNQFAAVLTHSVGAIAAQMDTRCQGQPIVVFNPLSVERQDVVEIELSATDLSPSRVRVVGADGQEVPAQLMTDDKGSGRVVFLARIPPLALELYDLQVDAESDSLQSSLEVTPSSLENHRYRVEIDAAGDLVRILDKSSDRELLAAPVHLQLLRDRSARWPAWEVLFEDLLEEAPDRVRGPAVIRIAEQGPARVALEITRQARGSTLRQLVRLAAGDAGQRVEVVNEVLWQTPGRLLKAAFPLAVSNPSALYDLGLGVIERGNNRREKYEVPAQQWAAVTALQGEGGVTILNDCKYGWDKPDDRTLRLTLLRSPRVIRRFRHQGSQDFGRHRFTYALFGHANDWCLDDSSWQAARLNQPLLAFHTSSHEGNLGRSFSFLRLNSEKTALRALKLAENGDRIVARLNELAGRAQKDVSLEFAAPVTVAWEVDGMEDELTLVQPDQHRLTIDMDPFALKTLALELHPPGANSPAVASRSLTLPFDVTATSAQGQAEPVGFDGHGHSIPAELFPQRLEYGGVEFILGPLGEGAVNALACRGQSLEFDGGFQRLHLLAGAIDGQQRGVFSLGDQLAEVEVGPYSGFLGRWSPGRRRWWRQANRDQTATLGNRHPVAWLATHRHGPDGDDEPYVYCYLFRYVLQLPAGCARIRLAENPAIRLFAATLTNESISETVAAQPLYD